MRRSNSTLKRAALPGIVILALSSCVITQDGDVDGDSGRADTAAPALSAKSGTFRDPYGRQVVLRGLNVAGTSKLKPFKVVRDKEGMKDIDDIRDRFGFNVIRLLFNWEAYEATPGKYDEKYLDGLIEIIDRAHKKGINTLFDFHHDAYSRWTTQGCGEGFPKWAVPADLRVKTVEEENPNATLDELHKAQVERSKKCKNWGFRATTDQSMHKVWEAFFKDFKAPEAAGLPADKQGVKTRYKLLMEHLAERLSSHAGVIGYDLMNEPSGCEALGKPAALEFRICSNPELPVLYEETAKVVRAKHPNTIMFLEGHISTNGGLATSNMDPDIIRRIGNVAYAPHFYAYDVFVSRKFRNFDYAQIRRAFQVMLQKANDFQAPLFLGEYGMFAGVENSAKYIRTVYQEFDREHKDDRGVAGLAKMKINPKFEYRRGVSGTQWVYTPRWTDEEKDGWNMEDLSITTQEIGEDGETKIRDNFEIRPYAMATAGDTGAAFWQDGVFSYTWTSQPDAEGKKLDATKAATTEIYLPKRALWRTDAPLSIAASGETPPTCTFDKTKTVLSCVATAKGPMGVTVKLQAPAKP
jgi:endoglycosylceramidase